MLASIVKVDKPKRLTGLGQKARSQVGYSLFTRRERSTAGVKSEPKSSIGDCYGTWKRCALARFARADLTARRVRSSSIERTEEAKAGV